jgi:hypothetical protein
MIELVPLPLFIIVPGTADPGVMTVCGEPGDPVTRPGPRDVPTLEDGAMGALEGAMGWKPPDGGACARTGAVAAARARVAVSQNLIISCSPGAR